MPGFEESFQRELARESWSLYGVGAFFVGLRTYARIHRMGMRGLQPDDYIMLTAFCWYTTLVVCLNTITTGGGSNLFEIEELPTFSEEEKQERVKGSKLVIVSEQGMLNTIYSIKACMLFMYVRLTQGLAQQKYVKALAVYVACGWVGTQLAFFFACRPFNGYYAVPPPNPQCTTLQHYSISQACFNISSDILMLIVMLPLLAQVNLPIKQRIALVGIFGLGSFVIVAAILTKYFNLSDVYSTVYMLWYVREASTAVYVSNLPMIWPLLREWFPLLRKVTPGHRSSARGRTPGPASRFLSAMGKSSNRDTKASVPMSHISKSKNSQYTTGTETDAERAGSAERINKPEFDGHGILAETTVDIDIDEGNGSLDTLDLEKQTPVGAQGHDRMRYEWDRSPTHTRNEPGRTKRGVTILGGRETDPSERRTEPSHQEYDKHSSHWRAPSLHSTPQDHQQVGRAV